MAQISLNKILIVTHHFWPENFRINDICDYFVKSGYDVTVLTGYPNYPEGQIFTEFKTAPEKFKNFNGADIIRVPIFARGQSKARLLANYISFLLSLCIVTFKTKNLKFDIVFVFGVSHLR